MHAEVREYGWGIIDSLRAGILVIDASGDCQYANAAWTELTSTPAARWRRRWLEVFSAVEREDRLRAILAEARRPAGYAAEWTVRGSEVERTLQVHGSLDQSDGRRGAVVLMAIDVTVDRARLAAATHRAAHDALTGLYNRGSFATFVEHALDRRHRDPGLRLALIVVDVDGLKETNDRYGHEAGDHLLKTIASRIQAAVRPGDVVARYGGDEFAVLCEDLHDDTEAEAIAERVDCQVHSTSERGPFSASVGVAVANGHPRFEELFDAADRKMYLAKRDAPVMGLARDQGSRERPLDQVAIAAHERRAGRAARVMPGPVRTTST